MRVRVPMKHLKAIPLLKEKVLVDHKIWLASVYICLQDRRIWRGSVWRSQCKKSTISSHFWCGRSHETSSPSPSKLEYVNFSSSSFSGQSAWHTTCLQAVQALAGAFPFSRFKYARVRSSVYLRCISRSPSNSLYILLRISGGSLRKDDVDAFRATLESGVRDHGISKVRWGSLHCLNHGILSLSWLARRLLS